MNVSGSPEPLPLISKDKKKDLKKYIICQNNKDEKGDSKLTSTETGRNVITEASKSLKDDLLHGRNTCYANYRKKKKRSELKRTNDTSNSTTFFANTGTSNPTCTRAKMS